MSQVAWLYYVGSNDSANHALLGKDVFLIGRQGPADLILPYSSISRQHAIIRRQDYRYYLTDLGSTNGTFVNGQSINTEPIELTSGDEIVLGSAISLRFHDPEDTPKLRRIGRLQGIWIDPETDVVWVDAAPIDPALSAVQFMLLKLLYERDGKIVSRDEIITHVWPDFDPRGVSGEAVDGLIKRLRQRLRETQPESEYIQVVRGRGLRLMSEASNKP